MIPHSPSDDLPRRYHRPHSVCCRTVRCHCPIRDRRLLHVVLEQPAHGFPVKRGAVGGMFSAPYMAAFLLPMTAESITYRQYCSVHRWMKENYGKACDPVSTWSRSSYAGAPQSDCCENDHEPQNSGMINLHHCQKCNGSLDFIINRPRYRCTSCNLITDEYGFPPFYNTIVRSEEWQAWKDAAIEQGWDWPESTETDALSPEHWKAFVKFFQSLSQSYNE